MSTTSPQGVLRRLRARSSLVSECQAREKRAPEHLRILAYTTKMLCHLFCVPEPGASVCALRLVKVHTRLVSSRICRTVCPLAIQSPAHGLGLIDGTSRELRSNSGSLPTSIMMQRAQVQLRFPACTVVHCSTESSGASLASCLHHCTLQYKELRSISVYRQMCPPRTCRLSRETSRGQEARPIHSAWPPVISLLCTFPCHACSRPQAWSNP